MNLIIKININLSASSPKQLNINRIEALCVNQIQFGMILLTLIMNF